MRLRNHLVVSTCLLAGLGVGTQVFADYVPVGYWAADAVSLPDAWELAGCAEDNTVRVAVIDGSVDVSRPYLSGRVNTVLSQNFFDDDIVGTPS